MKNYQHALIATLFILIFAACTHQEKKQEQPSDKDKTSQENVTATKDSATLRKEKMEMLSAMKAQGTVGGPAETAPPTPEMEAEKLFQEAARHAKAKRFEEALDVLNNSIAIYADNANAWFARGSIKYQLNDMQGALEDFSQCIAINPEHEKASINVGQIYITQNRFDDAVEFYNQLIERYDKTAISYYNRGIAFSKLNRLTQALNDFNKAIELNPNYSDALNNRGNVYFLMNKKEEACADWNKALELGNAQSQKAIDEYCK